MARTFAETFAEWESSLDQHQHSQSLMLLVTSFSREHVLGILHQWRKACALAREVLTELKSQKEQLDGYQASRDLIRERLEFAQREGSEALTRLSWLEENARRLQSYVEEKATCPRCGYYDDCEDGCEFFDHRCGEDMPDYQRRVFEARQALDGFAL